MEEILTRFWDNIAGRLGGPMALRFMIQPAVAIIIAIRAGLKDARDGRPLYFWSIFTHPEQRREILREGWEDVVKVFVMAILIDTIYQGFVFRWFYPGEALLVAGTLAILPYLIIRGLLNRIGRRW